MLDIKNIYKYKYIYIYIYIPCESSEGLFSSVEVNELMYTQTHKNKHTQTPGTQPVCIQTNTHMHLLLL